MVRVAVIIPCFNAGQYLLEAIHSLPPSTDDLTIETVIIDDGSTDPFTRQVISELANDDRYFVLRQPNLGVSAARNAGISACNAEYFLPLDADDKIEPKLIQRAVFELDKDPELGIVYSKADKFLGESAWPWDLPPYDPQLILFHNHIQNACLFRRDDWQSVGGYDESMKSGREDHDFLLKIIGLGRAVLRLDEVMFHYRQHEISLNKQIGNDRDEQIKVMQHIAENNVALYSKNINLVMKQYMQEHFRLVDHRIRYRQLERLRTIAARIRRK